MMPDDTLTPLARSLLSEILEGLTSFCRTGEPSAIDLRSLPLTEDDRAALDAALGRGSVEAVVSSGGDSDIWETGFSGVWWARHYDGNQRLVAERIEITAIPELLPSHGADILAAAERLRLALTPATDIPEREETQHAL
jgi:hydrogenase-1 operon protein HyaF